MRGLMNLLDTDVRLTDVQLKSNAPFFSNRAVSGRFQKRYTGVQFFELNFTVNYMSQDTRHVQRFIAMHQQGQPFDFPLSYLTDYKGSAQGLIQASVTANKGARKVTLNSFTDTLEAGTLVQFQNHSKLYTVTEDVKAGGEMKLFPNLLQNVQAGETVNYRGTKGRFILTNDTIPLDLQSISNIKLTATEVV
ncbi:hypothetical protein I5393_03800 [Citrobacter freundii]|nr:hypothetical protein [Citrobacter freundii]